MVFEVVRVMAAEPLETKEQLSVEYYPNLPMFHYLTKMLRFHGLFFDDHVVFRQVSEPVLVKDIYFYSEFFLYKKDCFDQK